MRIIVEGLDNSGKSTLIDNIVKHYKHPFVKLHHYAPPFKSVQDNDAFDLELYGNMTKIFTEFDHVIADRSHLGSLVYSPIYRNNDGRQILKIEEDLPDDVILFTLIDDANNLIGRDDGLSLSTDITKKNREIDLFRQAHTTSSIKHKLLINVQNNSIEAVKKLAIDFIGNV